MNEDLGRVVRRGRIRVDTRKAMAKLREHLLVDLHLYAVEVVRAAVLAGATRVDVTFDADDVIVTFDGEPLDAAELPRLFEHLTGEGEIGSARHLRLLALAVNAALGLDPAWVALTTASGGRAARITWSPALVLAVEREEKPLPEPEAIAPPAGMPASGTRFHLRRKVGWEMVRRAAAKTAPREVVLLGEAAHCLRIPLAINGAAPLPVSDRPRTLARAPITLPGVRSAYVEIIAGSSTAPHADFCEQGLLLARSSFAFGAHFPMAEHLGVAPPVRIVIDAEALPTNASRSAVREDAPLFGSLKNAAAPALADAISGIVAVAFGRGSVPEGVSIEDADADRLKDALGAFLCAAEASLIAGVELPSALAALLDLPLFQDGLGRPLTHTSLPREDPLLLWEGDEPLPEGMEPWAHQIVWRRGRVAERVFSARKRIDPKQLAAIAKRAAVRKRKLLALPGGEATVPDDAYLARGKFGFTEGPFAGLTGEVAIAADPGTYVRNLALRVFFEGRCFEAFPLPDAAVPLPAVIAISWPGHVLPKFAYEGVEPTTGLRAALAFAVRQAVLVCERFAAEPRPESAPMSAKEAAVLRAALATAVLAPLRMASAQGFEMPALAELGALVAAPVWPTCGGGFTSLQALSEYAAKTSAICVAAPDTVGRAADGRPVVCLPSTEIDWLSSCLRFGIGIVRYDAALVTGADSARSRSRAEIVAFINGCAAAAKAPVLHVDSPGCAFTVTLGASETRVWHGGVELARTALDDNLGGITVALDDDSIVPMPDWRSVAFAANQEIAGVAERAFAQRVVLAILGDPRARSDLFVTFSDSSLARYPWPDLPSSAPPAVKRFLIDRAARGAAVDASDEDRQLGARIEMIPLLTMIGEGGVPWPASLADVARVHPLPLKIPVLTQAPMFRPVEWRPLITDEPLVRDALARWSGGRTYDASYLLFEQSRRAAAEIEYKQFQTRPTLDPKAIGAKGDRTATTVLLPALAKQKVYGVTAALPAFGVDIDCALVEVLFEDRLLCEVSLSELRVPMIARAAGLEREATDGFERLSSLGRSGVVARTGAAAVELALKILERAREPSQARLFFADERALRLVFALVSDKSRDPRLDHALRHPGLLWATVQGEERPFNELRYVDGALWAGHVAYGSWLPPNGPPTDLDRPVLLLPTSPEGVLLSGILDKIGIKVRAVSDAIDSLQSKRARGTTDKPRLAQRPVHPRLAADLSTLLLPGMEGEIGLYEVGDPLAEVTALDGETRRIPLDVNFPARAVARVEVLTTSAVPIVAEKLARAAVRLLLGLVPALDEVPPFVRSHLRALMCRGISKERNPPAAVIRAPLFTDVDGAFLSFEDLLSGKLGDLSCTFDPPPYARSRQDGRTLQLTPTEHLQLHKKLKILNVTEWMRRDLAAERRREAPQAEHLRFADEARAHFLTSFVVNEGSLQGEIGVLAPGSAGGRGIQTLTTRRPLCTVDDSPGWPVAAVLNDDGLHPTRWFDGLLPTDEIALRLRVRQLASEHLRKWLALDVPVQTEVLASLFIDEAVPPAAAYGSTEPMTMLGHVYLAARWPTLPVVRVHVQGLELRDAQPISLAAAPIEPWLPLGGALMISHGAQTFTRGAAARVALALRDAAQRMLVPLLQKTPDDRELQTYFWNLRLLGSTTAGEPSAHAADGSVLDADHVISALQGPDVIWLSDRQGSIEGAFPEGTVPFVLADDGSPLVRVLRSRMRPGKLKMLGAMAAPTPGEALAPPSVRPSLAQTEAKFDAADASHRTSRSWLGAVLDRVTSLFAAEPAKPPPDTGFGDAVERTLRALRLRDEPVTVVREVTSGRLVRYDQKQRAISINVMHPALARHVAAPSPAAVRRACIALASAALSEVNIALENVTDHDEGQALLELLRQEAATAAAGKTVDKKA